MKSNVLDIFVCFFHNKLIRKRIVLLIFRVKNKLIEVIAKLPWITKLTDDRARNQTWTLDTASPVLFFSHILTKVNPP